MRINMTLFFTVAHSFMTSPSSIPEMALRDNVHNSSAKASSTAS
uniref:Uncharacterized protein n=1 Tax=Arundo donax TaxID=35708 RepID=A0A0A8Z1V1_ARUDO